MPGYCRISWCAGMFKGNLVTVLKTIPQSAIQFAAYDQAKDAMLTLIPRRQGDGLRQVERLPLFPLPSRQISLCE